MYAYLDATGVLEHGDDDAIKEAKKQYYKLYKASWRQGQRKSSKNLCIAFTEREYKQIADGARKHKVSPTRFAKTAALAYLSKRYIVPDLLAFGTIKQEIINTYCFIRKLLDENLLPFQLANKMQQQISTLEQKVLFEIECPRTLEQLILETIADIPGYRAKIVDLLKI